jgi:hypothetical protein
MAGVTLGGCFLAFCVAVLAVGKFEMQFGIEALRTLSVVAIVYGSQATIYALRGRRHLWGLRPTVWLVAFLRCRHSHYLDLGYSRNCDGTTARSRPGV